MRSPKGNINPPLVIQGEVDFAKQKTEGLKKTQSIYEICRKKDVNNFHTKKDCLQKDRKVNTNIKINHSDEWFVLNVGVSSKHILYRTKHSFVNILHMFFLFPKNHGFFGSLIFACSQKTENAKNVVSSILTTFLKPHRQHFVLPPLL